MLRLDKPPDRHAFQRHVTCRLVPSQEIGSPSRWTQLVIDLITCLSLPLLLPTLFHFSLCYVACWLVGCWLQGLGNTLISLLQGSPMDHPSWHGPLSTLVQNKGHLRSPKCYTGKYVLSLPAWPVIWAKRQVISEQGLSGMELRKAEAVRVEEERNLGFG